VVGAKGKTFKKPEDMAAKKVVAEEEKPQPKAETKAKRSRKRQGLPTRKQDAGPRVLKPKWKRDGSDDDADDDGDVVWMDDDDDEVEDGAEIGKKLTEIKKNKKGKGAKAPVKSKASPTTTTKSVNLGSVTDALCATMATYLKTLLSDEPVLLCEFLFRCVPEFGGLGFPVHTAAFWETIVLDLGRLLGGGDSKWKIKWKEEKRKTSESS
jgi:hypothetical protein